MNRAERLVAAKLKRQSDLFHAFEWLRCEALRGNRHALALLRELRRLHSANTSMSDPEPTAPASKVANPKDSLDAPVVLGMGSKTILPEGH